MVNVWILGRTSKGHMFIKKLGLHVEVLIDYSKIKSQYYIYMGGGTDLYNHLRRKEIFSMIIGMRCSYEL